MLETQQRLRSIFFHKKKDTTMTTATTTEAHVHFRNKSSYIESNLTAEDRAILITHTIDDGVDDGGSDGIVIAPVTVVPSNTGSASTDNYVNGAIEIGGNVSGGSCANEEEDSCEGSSIPQHQRRAIFTSEEKSASVGLRRRRGGAVATEGHTMTHDEILSNEHKAWSTNLQYDSPTLQIPASSSSSLLCDTYDPLDHDDDGTSDPNVTATTGSTSIRSTSISTTSITERCRSSSVSSSSSLLNHLNRPQPPPASEMADSDVQSKSTLYTYSQDSYAGRILTKLSDVFIKPHRLDHQYPLHSPLSQQQQQQPQHQHQPQHSINTLPQPSPTHSNPNPSPNPDINIRAGSAFAGFLSLLLTTSASYMLSPMRDAAALAVGVSHIPTLTLASTILALASSVPIGWLFEAPNEGRGGRVWRSKVGLTRGETQGTSLALFYRVFAIFLVGYAFTFKVFELLGNSDLAGGGGGVVVDGREELSASPGSGNVVGNIITILSKFGKVVYIAFFLVVHLMKLHSISLIWGVAQEAMEYEEQAKIREIKKLERDMIIRGYGNCDSNVVVGGGGVCGIGGVTKPTMLGATTTDRGAVNTSSSSSNSMHQNESDKSSSGKKRSGIRLKRLAFVGFGGTLGGILGSVFVSITASTLRLSGLLVVAAILLLLSAELSSELGQIMLRHWNEGKQEEYENTARHSCHSGDSDDSNGDDEVMSLDMSMAVNSESSFSASDTNTHGSLHGMSVTTVDDNDKREAPLSGGGGMRRSASGGHLKGLIKRDWEIDPSLKKVSSMDSMKRVASVNSIGNMRRVRSIDPSVSLKKVSSMGSMKRVASVNSIGNIRRARSAAANLCEIDSGEKTRPNSGNIDTSLKKVISLRSMKRVASGNSIAKISRTPSEGSNLGKIDSGDMGTSDQCSNSGQEDSRTRVQYEQDSYQEVDDNSFRQRLLRGIKTIIHSRLLMTIFTYNALYATTTVLLSFQRAELVANRSSSSSNNDIVSDAAFLAKINIASSTAVFALQASGMGAFLANLCGQRGTLSLMPAVRLLGVALLGLWHVKADGIPPNLTLFLILDEFTKVVNFSVAKPVRESLWSDLSNEARYEAKPIVDTLANRWGGGSAAFLMALLDQIMLFTGLGEAAVDGTKTLFGFPPLLFLCSISAVWWLFVSVDLGNIRRQIDLELKQE